MEGFDDMTYFGRHDVFVDVMTNFLTSWCVLYVMLRFWCHWCNNIFWLHDKLLTSWQTFDVMTNILTSWRVIMNILKQWRTSCHQNMFLTSWRTFWCHSELFDVMICFDIMTNLLKSWRLFHVITNFLKSWNVFEIMTTFWHIFYLFMSWRVFDFMTKTFWHHSKRFDIMTPFWRHDELFKWWRTFLSNFSNVIMACVDVMTNFITSRLVYDMTHFGCDKRFGAMTYVTLHWCHDKVLTSWNVWTTWHTFWCFDALFDVMSNFMTSWCVFLRFVGMTYF